MRTLLVWALSGAALALCGCTVVLDLDSLQGGGEGDQDGGSIDAADLPDANREEDAAIDADRVDASEDVDAGDEDGGPLDDAGTDGGGPTIEVSGTVVGLPSGSTLRLANGADEQDVAGGAGAIAFTFDAASGATYDITIDSAPAQLLCVVYRGDGTATADVSNVFVGCSTAVDLVSWFPFDDGDAHAARGTDWTSTTGSTVYTTDRAGRTRSALAEGTGFDLRLTRPLDGGAPTTPPGSAQFTITAWVRIPSAAPRTGDNIIGHEGPLSLSAAMQVNWRGGFAYGDLYFYWDGGFDRADTRGVTPIALDEWHQIAISALGPGDTSAATTFVRSVYFDGVRQATTATCCGWGNSTTQWVLGGASVQRDDLRLYSRQLSEAEIAGIYAAEHVP